MKCLNLGLVGSIFFFAVLANRLAGNTVSNMTYLVASGALKINSINQLVRSRSPSPFRCFCRD